MPYLRAAGIGSFVLIVGLFVGVQVRYRWGLIMAVAYRDHNLNFVPRFTAIPATEFGRFTVLVCAVEGMLQVRDVNRLRAPVVNSFHRAKRAGVHTVCLLGELDESWYQPIKEQLEALGLKVIVSPRQPSHELFRLIRQACGNPPVEKLLVVSDRFRGDIIWPIKLGWSAALVDPYGRDNRREFWKIQRFRDQLTLWWCGLPSVEGQRHRSSRWVKYVLAAGLVGLAVSEFSDWHNGLAWAIMVLVGLVVFRPHPFRRR